MSDRNLENMLGDLYDVIQDARAMPLAADKCILDRDQVLDMLEEILANMPGEIKQAKTIVDSRNEIISQARREAENIMHQAQDQARAMVTKEAIYLEARRRSDELADETQRKLAQLQKACNDYMDDALRRTEETIEGALNDVRDTRTRFRSITEAQKQRKAAVAPSTEE